MKIEESFDKKYKVNPKSFGEKPLEIVSNSLKYKREGHVLDLGVGNGRNTMFFLSKGFDVKGVDLSTVGIELVKEKAKKYKEKLQLIKSDVLNFKEEEKYDIVLAVGLLHFMKKSDILKVLESIKNWTRSGGLSVIATRMTQNYKNDLPHIFEEGELREYFNNTDWVILEYDEFDRNLRERVASIISRKL